MLDFFFILKKDLLVFQKTMKSSLCAKGLKSKNKKDKMSISMKKYM